MLKERYEELSRTGAKLEPEELRVGWHYCEEFDGLLTDGELKDPERPGVCVFCGFDGRRLQQ